MKILITGANGMLGHEICPTLANAGHQLFKTDIAGTRGADLLYLDICNFASVRALFDKLKPHMVIHLAAETDVDRCEIEKDHAYMVNTRATQNIAEFCRKADIALVYISTGAIFAGEKITPYIETDKPDPHSVYAKTKLEGEKAVRKLLKKYFIVRAGWLIGGFEKDKKFVSKILKKLETQTTLNVVNDKFGSPTFVKDFAFCLAQLIKTGKYGTYHMANKGSSSRFDIAKKIVEYLGRNDVMVNPVSSDEFPLPAPRGRFEVLENRRLEKLGLNTMRPWEEALKEYLTQLICRNKIKE